MTYIVTRPTIQYTVREAKEGCIRDRQKFEDMFLLVALATENYPKQYVKSMSVATEHIMK